MLTLIDSLREDKKKCSFLAQISFYFRLFLLKVAIIKKNNPKVTDVELQKELLETVGKYTSSITFYIQKFSNKSGCFGDLKNFMLPFISANKRVKNLSGLVANLPLYPPTIQPNYYIHLSIPLYEHMSLRRQSKQWDLSIFGGIMLPFTEQCAEMQKIVTKVKEDNTFSADAAPTDMRRALKAYTTAEQFQRFLGVHEPLSQAELEEKVTSNLKLYTIASSKLKTEAIEVQSFDDLLIISLHLLLQLTQTRQKQEKALLLYCNWLIECGLTLSPHSFQLKLLSVEVNERLSNAKGILEDFDKLKICQMQTLSLTHIIESSLYNLGSLEGSLKYSRKVLDYGASANGSNVGIMQKCLTAGNYPQIFEFFKLNSLTQRSHQLYQSKVVTAFSTIVEMLLEGKFSMRLFECFVSCESNGYFESTKRLEDSDKPKPSRYSLGSYASQNRKILLATYDTKAKTSWDFPNSASNKSFDLRKKNLIFSSSLTRGISTSSEENYNKWVETKTKWCDLFVNFVLFYNILVNEENEKKKFIDLEQVQQQIKTSLLQLNLIPLTETDENTSETILWRLVYSSFEFVESCSKVFAKENKDVENDTLFFKIRSEVLEKLMVKTIETIKNKNKICKIEENIVYNVKVCQTVVVLLFLSVRISLSYLPKKKKKKAVVNENLTILQKIKKSLLVFVKKEKECLKKLMETVEEESLSKDINLKTDMAKLSEMFKFDEDNYTIGVTKVNEKVSKGQKESLENMEILLGAIEEELKKIR